MGFNKMGKKIVVLHSGGLDSTVMWRLAKEDIRNEVIAVYFDIGHDYAWKEKAKLPPEAHVHDMTWFQAEGKGKTGNAMNNIFIPGRNMMFATIAACKYVPDEIWMGALMGEIHDQATDKNLEYLYRQNDILSYVLSPFGKVKVVFPFVDRKWGKLDVTRWGCQNGMQNEILSSSSCMNGEAGNCGRCGVCLRRAGIFPQLGMQESYNADPWSAAENKKMIHDLIVAEINQDDSHYDSYRRDEIIPTLIQNHSGAELQEILKMYKEQDKVQELEEPTIENNIQDVNQEILKMVVSGNNPEPPPSI